MNQDKLAALIWEPITGDDVVIMDHQPFSTCQNRKKEVKHLPEYHPSKGQLMVRYSKSEIKTSKAAKGVSDVSAHVQEENAAKQPKSSNGFEFYPANQGTVTAFGYHKPSKALVITFMNKHTYEFIDVDESHFDNLKMTSLPGLYFMDKISSTHFRKHVGKINEHWNKCDNCLKWYNQQNKKHNCNGRTL